jgi:hypothetical protein
MIPDNVYQLCRNGKSVTAELAANPSKTPEKAVQELYNTNLGAVYDTGNIKLEKLSPVELHQTLECGNWGSSRPSDLFLQVLPSSTAPLPRREPDSKQDLPRRIMYPRERSDEWDGVAESTWIEWGHSTLDCCTSSGYLPPYVECNSSGGKGGFLGYELLDQLEGINTYHQ